jgi:phage gp36-like protein
MPYCTHADLLMRMSEQELIELTDEAGAGLLNSDAETRAIADADGEIDGYCGGSYPVPFNPVPVMVRKISVDVTIYNLYGLRATLALPDDIKARYDNAVRFLKDVSKGLVKLGADAPAPANTENTVNIAGNDRIFTRAKLTGF